MSGPVRPPLTVAESDGSPTVRPVNTIAFNSADFTLTDQGGATVRVDVNPGGGTSLTDTQVGFGDSSNLLTGSTKFTYNDTAGSEQLKLIGTGVTDCGILLENTDTGSTSAPDLVLHRNVVGADNDFIGRMDFRGQNDSGSDVNYALVSGKINDASEDAGRFAVFVSGNASLNTDDSQFMIFGRTGLTGNPGLVSINNSARSDVDFRVSGDTNANLIRTDASLDGVGIGIAPPSGHAGITVRMTVKGDNDDIALMLQNDGTDADDGPEMVFYRNSSSPAADDLLGRIRFDGEDSGDNVHTYFRMTNQIKDPTDANEDGIFTFENRANGQLYEILRFDGANAVFNNAGGQFVDVQIKGDNDTILFSDASRDNLGVGTASPSSDVERLHVTGTGTDTLVRLESSDAGASDAPILELFRNSPSPASADYTGAVIFSGYEDTGASSKVTYGEIDVRMFGLDSTESGAMTLRTRQNNAVRPQISMNQAGVTINENHESVFDFVVESSESSAGFHNIYADSGQNNVGMGCVPDSDVERLHLKGSGATDPMMRIESTDADAAVGPLLEMFRNSASPADNDKIGTIHFTADDADGAKKKFAQIEAILRDDGAAAGQYDGAVIFRAARFDTEDVEFLRYGLDTSQNHSEVVVNENGLSYVDFRCESDTNATMFVVESSQNEVGVGARPTSGGAQLQVNADASFKSEIINENSTTILTSDQVKNSKIISNPSGSDATITLPVGEAGMRVTVVNVSASNTVTVAFNVSDSSIEGASGTFPRAMTAAQLETWLCYKANNWVLENFI